MTIDEVLNENIIELNMAAETKAEVIDKMAEMLYENHDIVSKEGFIRDVMDREGKGTTGVGMGIAIPHGKSDSVLNTSIAVAKLNEPVEWNSLDGKPVKLVFLLAVPKDGGDNVHLKLLSEIASMLMDDEFRERLYRADSKKELIEIMSI